MSSKTACGTENYNQLSAKRRILALLRLYWFAVCAQLRDMFNQPHLELHCRGVAPVGHLTKACSSILTLWLLFELY